MKNLILQPHTSPAIVLVQLDDIERNQLERVRPAALILRTSPKGAAIRHGLPCGVAIASLLSRLKRGTGADLSTTGSVRTAGRRCVRRERVAMMRTEAGREGTGEGGSH